MSNLAITQEKLRQRVWYTRGFASLAAKWDDLAADEQTQVDEIIQSGLRKFYTPEPLDPRNPVSHQWSFLQPITTLATVADQADYDLPHDYGGILGWLAYVTTTNTYCPIEITHTHRILALRSEAPSTTGRPQLAAIVPQAHTGTTGQRWTLQLWPTANQVYTLQFPMKVNPQALTRVAPYPYGGDVHGETILWACIAEAELWLKDGGTGNAKREYLARLAASVSQDAQLHRGTSLGYNGDRSSMMPDSDLLRRPIRPQGYTTYGGVLY